MVGCLHEGGLLGGLLDKGQLEGVGDADYRVVHTRAVVVLIAGAAVYALVLTVVEGVLLLVVLGSGGDGLGGCLVVGVLLDEGGSYFRQLHGLLLKRLEVR